MDTGTFHKKSSYLPSWTQSEKGKGKLARGRIARLRNAKSHVTVKVSPDWCRLPVTENRELLLVCWYGWLRQEYREGCHT